MPKTCKDSTKMVWTAQLLELRISWRPKSFSSNLIKDNQQIYSHVPLSSFIYIQVINLSNLRTSMTLTSSFSAPTIHSNFGKHMKYTTQKAGTQMTSKTSSQAWCSLILLRDSSWQMLLVIPGCRESCQLRKKLRWSCLSGLSELFDPKRFKYVRRKFLRTKLSRRKSGPI